MARRSLEIRGFSGRVVPNVLHSLRKDSDHLFAIFPGWAYSCSHPLLYFTRLLGLELGADVLTLDYGYNLLPGFDQLEPEKQQHWFERETDEALRICLAAKSYRRVTLVGKSIGSQAVGRTMGAHPESDVVMLTPTLQVEELRAQIAASVGRILIVIGSDDPAHDERFLDPIREFVEVVVIDGADHSLDVGGAAASIAAVKSALDAITVFLGGSVTAVP